MKDPVIKLSQPNSWQIDYVTSRGYPTIRFGLYRVSKQVQLDQVLLIVNGRSEYIEKYDYVAGDLQLPESWGVLSIDHVGQGQSQGQPGHIGHIREYVQALNQVIDEVIPNVPYHILAHSMGGLISLWGSLFNYLSPKSLHLLSPLIGVYNPVVADSFFKYASQGACVLGYERKAVIGHNPRPVSFEQNPLTTDKKRYKRIAKNPFGYHPITYGWMRAIQNALTEIHTVGVMQNLSCKTRISASTDDELVNSAVAIEWAKKARSIGLDVDEKMIVGKHELLSESAPSYQQVLERIKELLQV